MNNDTISLYSQILQEFSMCCADLSTVDHAKMLDHFANNKEGFSIYPPYQKAPYKTATPEEVVEGYNQYIGCCQDNRHIVEFAQVLYEQCMKDMRHKMTQAVINKQLSKTEKPLVLFEVVSVKGDIETVLDYKLLEDAIPSTIEDMVYESLDKLGVSKNKQEIIFPQMELKPSLLFSNTRSVFAAAPRVTNRECDALLFRVTTFSTDKN